MVYKPMQTPGDKKQIEVSAPDDTIRGVYANHMIALHSKEEFLIDFFNLFPPKGILSARIITSPGHLKRMIKHLSKSLENYEKNFGPVTESDAPGEEQALSE